MLAVAGLVGAAVAALFTGMLYVSDNAKLPSYEQLQRHPPSRGYDLVDLAAPTLTGVGLRLLAWISRTPVLGRLIIRHLSDGNKMIDVRRVAASVPDQPLYYPYVEPSELPAPPSEPLELTAFSHKNANAKTSSGPFKHWTISDYTTRYASGELSPVQVARAVIEALAHSETGDKPLRIMVEKHDELILEQALASAKRYAKGTPLGVLDGVPVAVKDEMEIAGHRMNVGTSFLGDAFGVAEEDALPVKRLRAQGAMILGTANMHEIGLGVTGFNMTNGTTRNPYNRDHHTGGSSSGPAAAVASGIVPLAVGIDGGGSIRIPAALCGIVGIKPTFMRVPPLSPDCPSVSHIGPIACSVRDAAIGYAVLSGGDPHSFPRSQTQPPVDLRSFELTASLSGLRVGYYGAFINHSSPEIASAVKDALQQLEQRGAELVEVELDHLNAIHLAHSMTITAEMAQNLDKFYSEFCAKASPETQIMLSNARHMTATDFVAAQRLRAFARRQLQDKVFSKVDVLVSPSTAITAPEIPRAALSYGELNTAQLGRIMRYSVYGNFVGNPGVAVPIGYDAKGLPISLQVQSSHFQEDVMLRVAHAAETIYASKQKQPEAYYSILDAATKHERM
jgi:Asp-tRNA(Asn)/Glu-tRNA(Gln) amidotransferase A subunit family amidase